MHHLHIYILLNVNTVAQKLICIFYLLMVYWLFLFNAYLEYCFKVILCAP